jgi:hypothetical protein
VIAYDPQLKTNPAQWPLLYEQERIDLIEDHLSSMHIKLNTEPAGDQWEQPISHALLLARTRGPNLTIQTHPIQGALLA